MLLAFGLLVLATVSQAESYDIVIRNGRVLDGMGNPWIVADVGIRGGKVAKIGRITEAGTRDIDATGKYVTPGWIDMMDQSGGVLIRNGLAQNKVLQGVTTSIGGEGGFPVPAGRIPEYFQTLERQGISMNFGSYFSETQARNPVLGPTARKPTEEELSRMRAGGAEDAGRFRVNREPEVVDRGGVRRPGPVDLDAPVDDDLGHVRRRGDVVVRREPRYRDINAVVVVVAADQEHRGDRRPWPAGTVAQRRPDGR